jgi:hypothetical protein
LPEPQTSAGDASGQPIAQPASQAREPGAEAIEAVHQTKHKSAKHRRRKAHIEHKVPGRIRMKVPSAKSDPAILEVYREIFSVVPGILKVKTRPETASIVIHYDPRLEQAFQHNFHSAAGEHLAFGPATRPDDEISHIAETIEREAEFLAQRSALAKHTVEFFKTLNHELKISTENTIDLKIVLAGGLAAFTFLEIGAEAATPMWVTLALFTLNELVELRSEDFKHPPAARA